MKNRITVIMGKSREMPLSWRRQYYKDHKDQILKYQKQYRLKHREKLLKQMKVSSRAHYLRNKEKLTKQHLLYFKNNPWMRTYGDIKIRCENPKSRSFRRYGGRGIKCLITAKDLKFVWLRDKANLMDHPSIDRIDNDGNYELGNIRFIERRDNSLRAYYSLKRNKHGQFIRAA